MANHKSSEKRIRQTIVKTERNRFYKTRVKNITRAFQEAVEANDKAKASEVFKTINQAFHKYISKGVYKKTTMARKVSRLNKQLNKLA
jgi:small subunit ribosomal protein S20